MTPRLNMRNLISVADQHIGMGWGVPDELKKLRDTMDMILAVICDAEKRQATDECVRLWLKRLQDVIYDADDVLDDYSYEAIRRKVKGNKVRGFFVSSSKPFNIKMASKFKNINSRLGEIAADMVKFQFENTSSSYHDRNLEHPNSPISIIPDGLKIFGREKENSDIINMLMTSTSSASCLEVSVICIEGMAGLGKTTLAEVVYKDQMIQSNFEPRLWVHVSDDFDTKKILKNILESINQTKCDDFDTLDYKEIVVKVHEKLAGNKYLLVLDDFRKENAEEWEKFRSYLSIGAPGSKILVTTGSSTVSSIVRGILPPYALQNLPQNECWSIMKNKAFSPGGAIETPWMEKIGIEIARKCDGSPFVSYFLGGLMHLKRSESDWLSIRDNDILSLPDNKEKIISILKLSFDELSPNLKQCFSYISLFPHGWEIKRETLIQLWVAEGFIPLSYGEHQKSPEDIANDYFHNLVSCSFFSDVKNDELGLGDIQRCKIQSIVWDLAHVVAGNHEFSILNGKDEKIPYGVRRLILRESASQIICKEVQKASGLRSIFVLKNRYQEVRNMLKGKRLRVVSSAGQHNAINIASFTSKLKHLRYLNLSHSVFEEVGGVSRIGEFYNLQTLVFHRCTNVHMILKDIGYLALLRHLDLSYSDIDVLPDCIVKLTNLQTLDLYRCLDFKALPINIGSFEHLIRLDISSTAIEELPDSVTGINSLRTVQFVGCRKLKALPSNFGALTRLRYLNCNGTDIKVFPESCVSNLCNLEIVELGHECALPKEIRNWSKLRRLTHCREEYDKMPHGIDKLSCLEELDPFMVRKVKAFSTNFHSGIKELADLNLLQVLVIRNLENVRGPTDAERARLQDKQNLRVLKMHWNEEVIDDSMVLERLQPHPNLRTLEIARFGGSKLPRWIGSLSCLPILVELCIQNCNSCEQLPSLGLLPCLKVLSISKMRSLKCLGEEFYHQQCSEEDGDNGVMVYNWGGIYTWATEIFPRNLGLGFPKLGWARTQPGEPLVPPLTVRSKKIAKTTTTASSIVLPPSLFPSLLELRIEYMDNLEEWIAPLHCHNSFPLLRSLIVRSCLKLRITPICSFSSLSSLELCNTNDTAVGSILGSRGGEKIHCLSIADSPDLMFFPIHNNNQLQSLSISRCSKFQGFLLVNGKDACSRNGRSSYLYSLKFTDCPALTSLPGLHSWTSLRKLWIHNCDKLKESIQNDLKSYKSLDTLFVDHINLLGVPKSPVAGTAQ